MLIGTDKNDGKNYINKMQVKINLNYLKGAVQKFGKYMHLLSCRKADE